MLPTGTAEIVLNFSAISSDFRIAIVALASFAMIWGGVPAGAGAVVTPPSTPTAATTTTTTPPALAKQQPIDQKEINNTVRLMLEDGTGKTGIDRPLSLVSLRDILIGSNLNTQPEFKKYFSSSSPDQFLKNVTKIILVNAMQTTQRQKMF